MQPTIRLTFRLVLVATAGILVVGLLYWDSQRVHSKDNGFRRLFPPHVLTGTLSYSLPDKGYYLAGIDAANIYLGNYQRPADLLITDFTLTPERTKIKTLPLPVRSRPASFRVLVDSPWIYLLNGAQQWMYRYDLPTAQMIDSQYCPVPFYTLQPVSPWQFVVKIFDSVTQQNILAKWTTADSHILRAPALLEKQLDGIFCTDGALYADRKGNQLVYLYYYRNSYLVTDRNLQLQFKAHTIDTNTQVKLKLGRKNAFTTEFAAPPFYVNRGAFVTQDQLYVLSAVQASNEVEEEFKRHNVVDVYSVSDRRYRFSFYIPGVRRQKVKSFAVQDDQLVVVYDDALMCFTIHH